MNRLLTACWRWLLILIVYLVLAIPVTGLTIPGAAGQTVQVPMLFQGMLRNAAYQSGFFPDNVYYEDWQAFCSAYAMNCLYLSLLLLCAWNVLYSRPLLGRSRENSARTVIWVFAALHVALQLLYAFYVFTLGSHIWAWLIAQPTGASLMLLLPQFLVVPFYLSARLLCPYRIYAVFPLFKKLRIPLRLRVFSKRGAY